MIYLIRVNFFLNKVKDNQRAHGLRCSVKQTTRADAEKLEQ